MPRPKLDDDALLTRLTDVFRRFGYEGASLTRISEATGLQRSSLYHRFPGGKPDMVQAVLVHADGWFATHVLEPLSADGEPVARVRAMTRRLAEFYERGEESCLLDTLSVGAAEPWHDHLAQSLMTWHDAMAKVARDAGLPPARARRAAEQALVRVQGALVVARATGETGPFARVMAELPALLTER